MGQQRVTVKYSFTENGKLVVHGVKSANKNLVEFVRTNFQKMDVELEKINTQEVYQMDVEYKLINQ